MDLQISINVRYPPQKVVGSDARHPSVRVRKVVGSLLVIQSILFIENMFGFCFELVEMLIAEHTADVIVFCPPQLYEGHTKEDSLTIKPCGPE